MEIPREIADSENVPADLDASARGPFAIPSPRRRRISGLILLGAAVSSALWQAAAGLPPEMWGVAVGFALLGVYHLITSWELHVRERAALETANRTVGFPVGHASAVLGYLGWRARPVWNVLVYSAEDPPSRRALVSVDAVDGRVVGSYAEEIAGS